MTSRRILVVDHHAIHSSGHALYRAIATEDGFDLRVIVPRVWNEHGVTTNFDESEASRLIIVPSALLFDGKTHRNLYGRLGRELRTFRPHILLVNSEPEGFLAFQAVLLCRLFSPNTAVVFMTWRNMRYGEPGVPFPVKWPWLSTLIEEYVLPRAAHGIALSPSAPAIFRSRGFNNISHIPPWVDQQLFSPGVKITTDPGEGVRELHVGYVGRFVAEKGIMLLLDAVGAAGISGRITLLGEGPLRADLELRARRLGRNVRVEFLSAVPHPQVPSILRRFDVLVLASTDRPGWSEQFGRVLIEAMACGVPVIGSSSGAIPSVIGDAGIIVRAGDVSGLATALRRLYENPAERGRLSEAGLRRVSAEFSVPVVARKYAELFHRISVKPVS